MSSTNAIKIQHVPLKKQRIQQQFDKMNINVPQRKNAVIPYPIGVFQQNGILKRNKMHENILILYGKRTVILRHLKI